jgi:hypothetical protein
MNKFSTDGKNEIDDIGVNFKNSSSKNVGNCGGSKRDVNYKALKMSPILLFDRKRDIIRLFKQYLYDSITKENVEDQTYLRLLYTNFTSEFKF